MKVFCAILLIISLFELGSSYKIRSRIVNGSPSTRGQFPFYAFLKLTKIFAPNKRRICGGTLLNEHYILTAAHCLYNTTKVEIHLGLLKRHEIETGRQIIDATYESFSIHPHYSRPNLLNDIALIRLPQPAIYTDLVRPVRLPDACDILDLLNGVHLRAIGNGRETFNGTSPSVLQHTILTTISQKECKDFFPFIEENKVFCLKSLVNNYNQSICTGDSGGPVVHHRLNTLYGITSFTDEAGCDEKPQGFTNIFAHLPWISEETGIQFPVCGNAENGYGPIDFVGGFSNN